MITPCFYLVTGVNPQPWRAPTVTKFSTFKNGPLAVYQNALAEAILDIRPDVVPTTEDIALDLWIWRELEKYETVTGRKQTSKRADRSNILKATEDALQARKNPDHPEWAKGILFRNDVQVVAGSTTIVEQEIGTEPKILLRIRPPGLTRQATAVHVVETMASRGVDWLATA